METQSAFITKILQYAESFQWDYSWSGTKGPEGVRPLERVYPALCHEGRHRWAPAEL